MKKLTEQDYLVRLQLISCCFAEKAEKLVSRLELGIACPEEITQYEVLALFLELLKCYTLDDTLTITEEDDIHSITYEEMNDIIEVFVSKCNLCFEPAGTEYINCE